MSSVKITLLFACPNYEFCNLLGNVNTFDFVNYAVVTIALICIQEGVSIFFFFNFFNEI